MTSPLSLCLSESLLLALSVSLSHTPRPTCLSVTHTPRPLCLSHTSPSLSHTHLALPASHSPTLSHSLSHTHPHTHAHALMYTHTRTRTDRHRHRDGDGDADIVVTDGSVRSGQGSRRWGGVSAVGERLHARSGCLRAGGLRRGSGGLVLMRVFRALMRVLRVLRPAPACQRLASSLETKQ